MKKFLLGIIHTVEVIGVACLIMITVICWLSYVETSSHEAIECPDVIKCDQCEECPECLDWPECPDPDYAVLYSPDCPKCQSCDESYKQKYENLIQQLDKTTVYDICMSKKVMCNLLDEL